MRFYLFSAVRIYMEQPKKLATDKETVTDDGEKLPKGFILGKEHGGMVFKNKTGKSVPQHFQFHLMTYPESYIDYAWDIVEAGELTGVLTRQANTYYFGDEKLAGSRARTESALVENTALALRVMTAIEQAMKEERDDRPQDVNEDTDVESLPGSPIDQEFQEAVSGILDERSERDEASLVNEW